MRIFQVSNLSHSFVEKRIFNQTNLMVQDGIPGGTPDHIGLVGQNGCGKSTFLKMLIGEIIPDTWSLETSGHPRFGYLDQYADIDKNATVDEYLHSVFDDLYKIEAQVNAIYETLGNMNEDEQMKALYRAQNLTEYLNEHEFDRIESKINGVLSGLGFTDIDRQKNVMQLSGGMKTKLILMKLLLQENDLLLLDEPTNFLDVSYIEWLGDYLSRYRGAFIVVSHDRSFLNRISNKIVEISNGKFKIYEGNYDYYLKEKEKRELIQEQQSVAQEKFIARSAAYVRANSGIGFGGKSRSKATWLKKMLAGLERIEHPEEIIKPQFQFKFAKGATKNVLALDSASVGYNGTPILPPISLKIERGEKVVFQGYNGVGKTTLLKSIYGDIPPCGGTIEFGEGIVSVFLRQEEDYENNFSHFNKFERKRLGLKKGRQREITVIEFAKEYYPEKSNKELQAAMFSCGLNEKHFFNQVRTLSGGEMMKLRLCLAMMNPVNFIILDEPTNHLDVYSKEVLMYALEQFEGTVLMTTHDRNVEIQWADRIINIENL